MEHHRLMQESKGDFYFGQCEFSQRVALDKMGCGKNHAEARRAQRIFFAVGNFRTEGTETRRSSLKLAVWIKWGGGRNSSRRGAEGRGERGNNTIFGEIFAE